MKHLIRINESEKLTLPYEYTAFFTAVLSTKGIKNKTTHKDNFFLEVLFLYDSKLSEYLPLRYGDECLRLVL